MQRHVFLRRLTHVRLPPGAEENRFHPQRARDAGPSKDRDSVFSLGGAACAALVRSRALRAEP
jgi:hypothetical protein